MLRKLAGNLVKNGCKVGNGDLTVTTTLQHGKRLIKSSSPVSSVVVSRNYCTSEPAAIDHDDPNFFEMVEMFFDR